jgi:hypothetical protein
MLGPRAQVIEGLKSPGIRTGDKVRDKSPFCKNFPRSPIHQASSPNPSSLPPAPLLRTGQDGTANEGFGAGIGEMLCSQGKIGATCSL